MEKEKNEWQNLNQMIDQGVEQNNSHNSDQNLINTPNDYRPIHNRSSNSMPNGSRGRGSSRRASSHQRINPNSDNRQNKNYKKL